MFVVSGNVMKKNTFGGDRTHGQQLKRLSLYRLSYEGFMNAESRKKIRRFYLNTLNKTKMPPPGIEPGTLRLWDLRATNCATEAINNCMFFPVCECCRHLRVQKAIPTRKPESFPAGTRTRNPLIRSQMPYPLGHGELRNKEDDSCVKTLCKIRRNCASLNMFMCKIEPAGRIELPTFCLQSRCSATKLSWQRDIEE